MRYCLRWRIHRVPLKQEIEYIRSYVYILNLRNDYKISLITEIPEEYENVEIPKMTLQPLIENAFTHAIEPLGQDAKINVSAEIAPDGKRLHLCVQDFGPGIEEKRLTEMRRYLFDDSLERSSTGSIGLKNIQQRLTMFYGKDYRLEIISVENKGTLVSVPIPLTSEVKE
jgi:two-component system sensor histidine kinase YesM